MIQSLYESFRNWSDGGSIYILSDLHLGDTDCKLMDPNWIEPDEQIEIINNTVHKCDTFICLGDVGSNKYIQNIKCPNRVLLLGNHDRRSDYDGLFSEIYSGPLFISDRILLSHEPVIGLPWCLNIHGHDHNMIEVKSNDKTHLNLAANVCGYKPANLGSIIKSGALSDIPSIHRVTIDKQKKKKDREKDKDDLRKLALDLVMEKLNETVRTKQAAE